MANPKKPARPRLDAVIRHIKIGSYDDEMEQIKEAMDERNRVRQDAVLKTVREVFGKKAMVVLDDGGPEGPTPADEIPRPRRPRPGGTPQASAPADLPPELAEAEQRARAEEARLEAEANGAADEDEEAEIISNSPQIGSID